MVNEYKKYSLFCNNSTQKEPLCGIDEAGRGPIAGDLVFAAVILNKRLKNLNDSKKINEKNRELLYEKIILNSKYYIHTTSAYDIDKFGLSVCIKEALRAIKAYFGDNVKFLYDGNSSFGVDNIHTLIKADEKIKEVSAASILAKVYRDRLMLEYDKLYPKYNFKKNKGYGTKEHLEAIKKYGYCPIHRRSYKIKLFDEPTLFYYSNR